MIVVNVTIFNNTGMELELGVISGTSSANPRFPNWTRGVDDVGQTIGAHNGLEATLQGPDNEPFSAVLRWAYPDALGSTGSFSTQVCRTVANGTPDGVMALTDQTTPGTVRVDAASLRMAHGSWQVSFIVSVPPAPPA